MKRLLSIVLTLVLMLSSTMSTFATESTVKQSNIMMIENGFKIETVECSKKDGQIQKVKVTNSETGEVEYLETFLVDGKYSYLSTSKQGKIRTETLFDDKDNFVKITNEDTKEVKYLKREDVITNKTAPTNKEAVTPNITTTSSSLPFVYQYYSQYSGSRAADWTTLTTMAAILMAVSGGTGAVPAIIFAMATGYISNSIETVYYHKIDANATYNYSKYWQFQTWYYYDKDHNYFKEYTCHDTYTCKWQYR